MKQARIRFVEDEPNWAAIVATGDITATSPKQRDIVIGWDTEYTVTGLKFSSRYRRI